MVYLIAYKINDSVYDYSSLIEAIKSLGKSYQHPMDAVWFVSVNGTTPRAVNDILKTHLHSRKDYLYIMEVNSDSKRQGWLPKLFWSWLRENTDD